MQTGELCTSQAHFHSVSHRETLLLQLCNILIAETECDKPAGLVNRCCLLTFLYRAAGSGRLYLAAIVQIVHQRLRPAKAFAAVTAGASAITGSSVIITATIIAVIIICISGTDDRELSGKHQRRSGCYNTRRNK